jgi:hypothetical protein
MEFNDLQRHQRTGPQEDYFFNLYRSVDNSLHPAIVRDNNRGIFNASYFGPVLSIRLCEIEGVLGLDEGKVKS